MTSRSSALTVAIVATGLWLGASPPATAEPPIRIGASLSQSGRFAPLALNQLRGYQLCIKQVNDTGGVLGRGVELVVEDDQSEPTLAARIYEKLITQDKVDAVLGPYSSAITEAVADIAERHRTAMVAPGAATTSMFRKGRKFIFMVFTPGELYMEGFIELASRQGLRTVALLYEDSVAMKAIAQGAADVARKRGLQVVLFEGYPKGTTDFAAALGKVASASPDVLAAATYFDDAVGIARRMSELKVNPRMFGLTAGVDLPRFHELLGRDGELVYGATQWTPELVTLVRGGQLIPVSRRYPGAREFVETYRKEFPGADLSYHSASGYSGCHVLMEAIRQTASLDGERLRAAILKMDMSTVYGTFRVDKNGVQVGHRMLVFQWQDGKKVIVWPEELAAGRPRVPVPSWNQR